MNSVTVMERGVADAEEINREHELAQKTAETAVQHAVRCGELLMKKKAELKHGEFIPWVEKNCEFSDRSAQVYMRAAFQKRRGLRFSSLAKLLAAPDHKSKSRAAKPEWDGPAASERLLRAIEREFTQYGAQSDDCSTIAYFLRQHIKEMLDEDSA